MNGTEQPVPLKAWVRRYGPTYAVTRLWTRQAAAACRLCPLTQCVVRPVPNGADGMSYDNNSVAFLCVTTSEQEPADPATFAPLPRRLPRRRPSVKHLRTSKTAQPTT